MKQNNLAVKMQLIKELLMTMYSVAPNISSRINKSQIESFVNLNTSTLESMLLYTQRFIAENSNNIVNGQIIRPMMRKREVAIIEEIITKLKPKKCLEWGSGASTLFFPPKLDDGALWFSVEHDWSWYNKISEGLSSLNKNNVEVIYNHVEIDVGNDTSLVSDSDVNDSYHDFKKYISSPDDMGLFDLILIDGRARIDCLRHSIDLLDDDGVVLVHDSNLRRYRECFSMFPERALFEDLRIDLEGGIWLARKGSKIDEILDLRKHKKYWRDIVKLNRAFLSEELKNKSFAELYDENDLFRYIDRRFF